jgi:hypothetical protein
MEDEKKLSYDKLLVLAKQLKAVNKRLVGDKEAIEKELAMAQLQIKSQPQPQPQPPHTQESKDPTVAAPPSLPVLAVTGTLAPEARTSLFWELIQNSPELHQNLARASIRALILCLSSSKLGACRLRLRGDSSAASAFRQWKRATAAAALEEHQRVAEDGNRARKELEAKCT